MAARSHRPEQGSRGTAASHGPTHPACVGRFFQFDLLARQFSDFTSPGRNVAKVPSPDVGRVGAISGQNQPSYTFSDIMPATFALYCASTVMSAYRGQRDLGEKSQKLSAKGAASRFSEFGPLQQWTIWPNLGIGKPKPVKLTHRIDGEEDRSAMNQQPIEYPFPDDPSATGYRVFPPEVEDDDHVFFHGTADAHRASILAVGFRIPSLPLAPSVSFARTSALPLGYASEARSETSPRGCIFAVRYEDLTRNGLSAEASMLHDYTLDPPPLIVGYCIVPSDYRHI